MTQSEFLNIVTPFKDKLYRLSKRLLVSHEEAQDATQEVMIKLWNQKSKMADYKNVEAFSMTLTKNYCLDRLRSKQSQNLRIVHSNYEEKQTGLDKHLEQKDSVSWMSSLWRNCLSNNGWLFSCETSSSMNLMKLPKFWI